ncbi:MAG: iron-containing alcohol dehydrogenase [Bacteroidales bacterium]|nr:iron-containing alcohol dehydrogenase [Bacteroidales bacterium]
MVNFKIDNPTIVHFGKDVIRDLGKTVKIYGNKVLLVYGKGSIKSNGIYDAVIEQLNTAGVEVVEYSGIKPNPVVEDVNAAVELGRKENIDLILAVGGGSVIDSAKIVSVTIPLDTTAWRVMIKMVRPGKAVPLISVLTLAATGTEMNQYAVVQNDQAKKKLGIGYRQMYPRHSFLDPQYTYSVPRNYTAFGIVDLMAHTLENYFGSGEATLSDRFVFAILNETIEYGPKLINNLHEYDLRAKIMYAATMALNGLTGYGRESGDWGVHDIGHVISVLFDTPHGASLSIAYPAWLKVNKDKMPERIALLGRSVFGVNSAEKTIDSLENFFKSIGSPVRLNEAGIHSAKKPDLLETMIKNKVRGSNFKLTEEEMGKIVELMDAD